MVPPTGLMQRSFGAGELAPALYARADSAKYAMGLRQCHNWLVHKAGGASNRPGTHYVASCKTNSPTVQLIPYFSEVVGESMLLECGAGYIRFYLQGAQVNVAGVGAYNGATAYVIGDLVLQGGVNYYCKANSTGNAPPNAAFWYPLTGTIFEVPTGFAGDLPAWSQNGRTITLTHHLHPAQELTFISLTRWTIRDLNPQPGVQPPTGLGLFTVNPGVRTYAYVVTAAKADSYEESEASGQAIDAGIAEPTPDKPITLTWDDPALFGLPIPAEFYVYCDPYGNGIYGFIGTAAYLPVFGTSIQFRDPGLVPDFTVTPPIPQPHFAVAGEYPSCVAHYQQRRFFGNTDHAPDAVFASRVGLPSNFGISSPLQDDDALIFRLAANQHNPVRHLVPLKQLIVLTDAGGWIVEGGTDGALAPQSINANQHIYAGCSSVRPVVVGNAILYVQARGTILRDVQFNINVDGLAGRDLTIFSSHLFGRGKSIRDLDYQPSPDSIIWVVREDGYMLGLTYLPDQDIWAWHRHSTGLLNADGTPGDGFFWSVCVVSEDDEDAVYFIVRRSVNGATVRYIERLATREIVDFDLDCHFVDAGLTYVGAPVNNVGGLGHLVGKVCAVLGDGAVIFNGDSTAANAANFTVNGGGTFPVVFPAAYSKIHVGLPIRFAEIETLDIDEPAGGVRDKQKRVPIVTALVDKSSRGFSAGPDTTHLSLYRAPSYEPAADEFTGQVEIAIQATFNKYGRVLIRQTDPLPVTILAVIPNAELGG